MQVTWGALQTYVSGIQAVGQAVTPVVLYVQGGSSSSRETGGRRRGGAPKLPF